jgi:hypothetical protein
MLGKNGYSTHDVKNITITAEILKLIAAARAASF